MQIIEFGAQRFSARADRTLWHPDSSTLLLSDLHLGKGAHFRQSGIPVPDGGETDDLNRLSNAITETNTTSVWILGDLFHHPPSITDAQMDRWTNQLSGLKVQFHVILGNHDRNAHRLRPRLAFTSIPNQHSGRASSLRIIQITDPKHGLQDMCIHKLNSRLRQII